MEKSFVLVTGSTRGIGLGIAEVLAAQGAVVGVHGRDSQQAQAVADALPGEGHCGFAADLSDPEAAARLVDDFAAHFGRIDGLINNAGSGKPAAFRAQQLASWRQTFALNLESAMLASRAAYIYMRKQKAGNIVNIASISAHGPGHLMGADYAASKAALVSMTQSLALEAARFKVRCNAISPGFIETEMTQSLPERARQDLKIPLGRLGAPQDVGKVAAFLLSDAAAYMTGQVLHVDGGLWMHR